MGQEAQAELERLRGEGETITGSMAALGRRTAAHFAGRDAESDDVIELWGRRIGRALSLAGVIGLGIYLYLTYVQ